MSTNYQVHATQRGSVLLEALIAILIFSMGILAIVGLQGTTVKLSADAKYRTDAGLLADQLIGQMWVSDRTPATLQTEFNSPNGAKYKTWLGAATTPDPGTVRATLPGVTTSKNLPTVVVDGTGKATVTLNWETPGAAAHKYISTAQISKNN